jgi:hypothetical protein
MHVLDIRTPTMTVNHSITIVSRPLKSLTCNRENSMHYVFREGPKKTFAVRKSSNRLRLRTLPRHACGAPYGPSSSIGLLV